MPGRRRFGVALAGHCKLAFDGRATIVQRRQSDLKMDFHMKPEGQGCDFLAGGGEMGALTRAYDWSSTSLGPPETWPQSLRVTMRIVLNTHHPMFIWWGPDLIQFYNDAYRETMGPERHPSALGAKGRECWAEIWDIIGPQINYVMAGKGSTWDEDRLIPVTRYGRREDVWWTYSYGPIDVGGKVGGVLVICNDVTAQHLATEGLQDQTIRLQGLFEQAPTFSAVLSGPEHRFELANAAYKRLVGQSRRHRKKRSRSISRSRASRASSRFSTAYSAITPHMSAGACR